MGICCTSPLGPTICWTICIPPGGGATALTIWVGCSWIIWGWSTPAGAAAAGAAAVTVAVLAAEAAVGCCCCGCAVVPAEVAALVLDVTGAVVTTEGPLDGPGWPVT